MSAARLSNRIVWFVNRLRCMTLAEVVYRLRQAGLKWSMRRGLQERNQPAPQITENLLPLIDASVSIDAAPYLDEAREIIAGHVVLFAVARFNVGPAPQWNRDPLTGIVAPSVFSLDLDIIDRALVGDIKHVWELNRHLHLVRLAQAYTLSKDEIYVRALAMQLTSWLAQCPPYMGPNWTSSLELGIRLINWSLIWQLLGGAEGVLFTGESGSQLRQAWLDSIYAHCDFIERHLSRHSSANNHLIGELSGLFVAARTWPFWARSANWGANAKRELEEQACAQYTADGVNREQAFSYHVFSAEFLFVAGICGERSGQSFPPDYWLVLQRALHFLRCVRDAGGNVPMVGDADDGIVFRLDPSVFGDRAAILLGLGDALFNGGGSCESARWLVAGTRLSPAVNSWSDWNFAEGGYLLFGRDFGRSTEVKGMVDCGALGYLGIAAHGHADALALTLSIGGEPCLVDPGTYSYWQDLEWRDYFRGTSAHNTLRVDGLDQSVSGGRFMWTRKATTRVLRMPNDPEQFDFTGEHDGYMRLRDPLRHQRQVLFDAEHCVLIVKDLLSSRGQHLAEQFWHFAPSLQVMLVDGKLQVQGKKFRMYGEFSGEGLALEIMRGAEQPPLGWYSTAYEIKQPCDVLRISTTEIRKPIEARFTIVIC